jgi:hypothetical protein
VSVDLELTGISPWNNNILDTPEERFQKYKQTAEKYKIIQFDLTTFKKENNQWFAKPYNCYIFPEDNSVNHYINMETPAIIFNREHKIDFNKWIYEGIPYIN